MSDLAAKARALAMVSEAAATSAGERWREETWFSVRKWTSAVRVAGTDEREVAHGVGQDEAIHIAHHDPATMAEIRATLRALADEVERLRGDVVWHTTARAGMEAELARLRPVVEAARVVYAMRALRGGNSLPNAIDRLGAALKEHDDA